MPKCEQSSNNDGGKANIPMVGIWLSIEKQCVTQPLPNTWKQKISRLKHLIYKINESKKSISNAEENKTVSIKKIKNISLTTLSRTSTVDSRIPKHKKAKIQRHSIALKVVPFDTITKSDNQYKTINTSKYILLGNP